MECDGAVVGATNLFLNPEIALAMARFGIIAEDGQTRTFDRDANGYGRAEGINAVYVKRLGDATRDGDSIRGVIRATWTNRSASDWNGFGFPALMFTVMGPVLMPSQTHRPLPKQTR